MGGAWSSITVSMYETEFAGGLSLVGDVLHCVQNGGDYTASMEYMYGTMICAYITGYGWMLRGYAGEGGTCYIFPGYYYAMWGASMNDIWLAGASGDVLHYDETSYEVVNSGTDQTLRAMWGDSEDYIFAVGDGGAIVHYDGSEWSVMESGTSEDLGDIWGSRAVVATRLGCWEVETLSDLISLRWELVAYEDEPFEITRTEFSSPPRSIRIDNGEIERKGMTFSFDDREIELGSRYAYAVAILCDDGPRTLFESGPVEVPPASLSLVHYPNPFNPSTVIRYTIPEASAASLCIYDVNGKRVRTLIDKTLEAGSYAVEWDGQNDKGGQLPSGIYILSLRVGKASSSSKLVLVR